MFQGVKKLDDVQVEHKAGGPKGFLELTELCRLSRPAMAAKGYG